MGYNSTPSSDNSIVFDDSNFSYSDRDIEDEDIDSDRDFAKS